MFDAGLCRIGAARKALTREALALATISALICAAPAARAQDAVDPPPEEITLTLIAPLGTETLVVANQVIRDNVVTDIGNVRATMLDNSVVGTLGIGQVNQDAGVASNQANLLLLTSSTGGTGDVFHDYNLIAHRVITGNTLTLEGGSRTNTIQNSFNNAQGYFQVNQNTGNLNAQANVGVVSIGAGAGTAFAIINDKTLAGYTTGNTVADAGTTSKADIINGGFDGFRGISQITQSSGDANAITNGVAITITVLNVK